MRSAARLHKAYEEDSRTTGPVGPAHYVALDYAEPSPMWLGVQQFGRRVVSIIRTGLIVALIGAYPAMMVLSSRIDDKPIVIPPEQSWSVPGVGVAIHKIAREVEGVGWASDRPVWHPQARLTGIAAWQDATAGALSQHVRLLSELSSTGEGPDSDLAAAARLLTGEPGQPMRPRLTAAAEALNRFDTRASRGLAMRPSPDQTLGSEAELFASWAAADRAALAERINAEQSSWLASKADLEVFFSAKARAHVAREMIAAGRAEAPLIAADTARSIAAERAQAAWTRAAELKPLFVSNRSDSGLLIANHLSSLAYYLHEAELASVELAQVLSVPFVIDSPPDPADAAAARAANSLPIPSN